MLNVKKLQATLAVLVLVFMFALAVSPVLAATTLNAADLGYQQVANSAGLKNGDLKTTIGGLIRVILGFLGVIAIGIVLIGGFKYMTSGGEETKTKDARKYIVAGIIGLAIVLAAYAITGFVITSLVGAIG